MKAKCNLIAATLVCLAALLSNCTSKAPMTAKLDVHTLDALIEKGDFKRAKQILSQAVKCDSLSESDKYLINFEKDKMNRILGEFTLSDSEVKEYIRKYIPDVDDQMIETWIKTGALEAKTIDGKRLYFYKAPKNLFLINPECAAAMKAVEGPETGTTEEFLKDYLPKVIANAARQQQFNKNIRASSYIDPVKMTIHVLMRVMPEAVPAGEIVRIWLPYPKETERQKEIEPKRIFVGYNSNYTYLDLPNASTHNTSSKETTTSSTSSLPLSEIFYDNGFNNYIISAPNATRRSIYFQMLSNGQDTIKVGYQLSFTSYNQYFAKLEEQIKPYDTTSLIYRTYSSQRERHIIFTDQIKTLADSLTAGITEPYEKVKKIWSWITENIPWAGARDYSTIPNIPSYVLKNRHGDCGQVSLLFITMARYKGIPARWQSGWMLHPGNVNLHDWAEVYYEGVGWVPVDQSFGYITEDRQQLKYFFSRGLDAYRLIVNDDYGHWAPLYPAKIYPHSDEVDFQMGEVEWRGGNVLTGKWKCWMDVEYN